MFQLFVNFFSKNPKNLKDNYLINLNEKAPQVKYLRGLFNNKFNVAKVRILIKIYSSKNGENLMDFWSSL